MRTDQHVAVIGLGYVGLPLAISFVDAGCTVVGVDANLGRVQELQSGHSPIDDIDDAMLASALGRGLTIQASDEADLAASEVIFVCVPTPITKAKDPDLNPVLVAAQRVCRQLRAGQLVILQSTTYPGTTTGPFQSELERSGLVAGRDFDLAYAPERVNPGDPASTGRAIPRLVGGLTPAGTARAASLLRRINTTVHELTSPDAAELAKLLENVFRNVNIALVNQLALLCERMGLDVWEVIDAAATKPFGFMPFGPGPVSAATASRSIPTTSPGAPGSSTSSTASWSSPATSTWPCPATSSTWLARPSTSAAGRSTEHGSGSWGWPSSRTSATPATRPPRPSWPGSPVAARNVSYHDPHVPTFRDAEGVQRTSVELPRLLAESDAIVVLASHRAIDWELVYGQAGLIIDTVGNSNNRTPREHQVLRLGAGWSGSSAVAGGR